MQLSDSLDLSTYSQVNYSAPMLIVLTISFLKPTMVEVPMYSFSGFDTIGIAGWSLWLTVHVTPSFSVASEPSKFMSKADNDN